MTIIYYTTEHTKAWFKEWLTFKFVEISIGKFPAYKENSDYLYALSGTMEL